MTRSRATRIPSSGNESQESDYIRREEFNRIIGELKTKQAEEIAKIRAEAMELAKEIAITAAAEATREAVRVAMDEINNARSNAQSSVIVPSFTACNCACATSPLRPIAARSVNLSAVENSVSVAVSQKDPPIFVGDNRIEPDTFDGSGSWNQYVKQFKIITEYNKYSEEEKAMVLVASLRGSARAILLDLSDEELTDFQKVKGALDFTFGETHFTPISYAEFHDRKQGEKESLVKFAVDLKRLVRLAYPECNEETKDWVASQQFVLGIFDKETRLTLRLEGVSSLEAALTRAEEIEAIIAVEKEQRQQDCRTKRDSEKSKSIGSSKSTSDLIDEQDSNHSENRRCWFCGEADHIKKFCPHRRRSV